MRLSQSFGFAIPLTYHAKALIFTVLYGHRFFYIPICAIYAAAALFIRLSAGYSTKYPKYRISIHDISGQAPRNQLFGSRPCNSC